MAVDAPLMVALATLTVDEPLALLLLPLLPPLPLPPLLSEGLLLGALLPLGCWAQATTTMARMIISAINGAFLSCFIVCNPLYVLYKMARKPRPS